MKGRLPQDFPVVTVRRISDDKIMEMSAKVFENVHAGGQIFELAEKARKEK